MATTVLVRLAVVTTALLFISTRSVPEPTCFPAEAGVDAFRMDWYCKQLSAAHENQLLGDPAYRFTHIPTFHPMRVVTVSFDGSRPVITGKVLSGRGGYEPGDLASTTERELAPDEWRHLEERLLDPTLWEPPPSHELHGRDGAQWILEGRNRKVYRFQDIWSPDDTRFIRYRKTCEHMLELAGIKPAPDELY